MTRKEKIAVPASTPLLDKRVGLAIVAFGLAIIWTGLLGTLGSWFGLHLTSLYLGLVGLAIAVFFTLVFAVVSE